jgi:lipopolysaccharide export system permease protein
MVLYDGQRFEGVPGTTSFRILDFAEHGIPIVTRTPSAPSEKPATLPTSRLLGSTDPVEVAELQWRLSAPLATVLLTILSVPLSRTNPRQGRYSKVIIAVLAYIVYANLLAAARVWVEQGRVPYTLGLWWVHALLLLIGGSLITIQSRVLGLRAPRVAAA